MMMPVGNLLTQLSSERPLRANSRRWNQRDYSLLVAIGRVGPDS